MKDRIIQSYVEDFKKDQGLTGLSDSSAFEQFVNYCVVSRDHPEPFALDDLSVGGGGDLGIDGLAIFVNEHLVSSVEEINHFKTELRRLDVQFVFTQAKQRFAIKDIGNFFDGVRRFFEDESPREANAAIRHLHSLKEHIYDCAIDMDEPPVCRAIYAAPSKWQPEEPARDSRISRAISDLQGTSLFSKVDFVPLDSNGIRQLYKELRHGVSKSIEFGNHETLPEMPGVKEAYLGIVPGSEYLKLINRADGSLDRRLFYDNVRDFQGHNTVNQEIADTLQSQEGREQFVLLNNGITIVAGDLTKVGNRFNLEDFQVVNGCQTSHILHQNKGNIANDNDVHIPIKLIVTRNVEVKNSVVMATNRQTEVKLEAFESLSPFQKLLEEYYEARRSEGAEQLYYERRSKQYAHLVAADEIEEERIFTLASQVLCFVAMFLNEPHSSRSRYYGELLQAYRSRIFVESHKPDPYYVSAAAYYRVHDIFGDNERGIELKTLRYQFLLLFRLLVQGGELPRLNSHAIEDYCQKLLDVLRDKSEREAVFRRASAIIEEALEESDLEVTEAVRRRAFTGRLIERASEGATVESGTVDRHKGSIIWFSEVKGYGFIRSGAVDEDVFVHATSISGSERRGLTNGDRVEFTLLRKAKGPAAEDVTRVD